MVSSVTVTVRDRQHISPAILKKEKRSSDCASVMAVWLHLISQPTVLANGRRSTLSLV